MDVLRESIENACVDFDTREILDDKRLCADTIKVLADAYATVVKADAEMVKATNAHEEELAKIENQKANDTLDRDIQTYKIESEEKIQMAKLEVEKARVENEKDAADQEIEVKAADLEQKRKDKLAEDIIAFVGTATTACVGVAGVWASRKNLLDVMKFEETGKIEHIPITTAFRLLWNKRK